VTFFKTALLAFGGAYSFLPLMEKELVQNQHWLENAEYLEIIGITKLFPGAVSIKFATYTGYKVAGVPGAILANLGNLMAPVILILIATFFYSKYKDVTSIKAAFAMIQYAVFAMIIAVAIQLVDKEHVFEIKHIAVIIASFLLFTLTKLHPAFIIITVGCLGAILG